MSGRDGTAYGSGQDGIRDRDEDEDRKDPEGHPAAEGGRHRAASGAGSVTVSRTGKASMVMRGDRCDS